MENTWGSIVLGIEKSKGWVPRVLVVGVSPGLREMIVYAFQTRGWEAQGVADGIQACRYLGSGEFAVIVADLQIPGMDGLGLLQRVRRIPNPPPVVIQITLPDCGLEAMLREAGAFRVLLRAGPLHQLVRSVEEAIMISTKRPV
jgi:DNA-binding response OmpR family regulator